jgi:hypothetical protein
MKWVKFAADFKDTGSLYRLSVENTDVKEYNALAKKKINETCFKTSLESRDKFEQKVLNGEQVSLENKSHLFHKWVCHNDLPEAYFEEKYFDQHCLDKFEKTSSQTSYSPHPYEIFIGGWLEFYDSEVMSGDSDHGVYFKWDCKCKCVTVYITQMKPSKRWNVNMNINITNPPGTQDPPPPKNPPPYC